MTIYYSNKKNNHLKAIYLLIYQVYIYIGIEEDILSKRIYGKKMCIQRWWISFYIYKMLANNKSRFYLFFFFFAFVHEYRTRIHISSGQSPAQSFKLSEYFPRILPMAISSPCFTTKWFTTEKINSEIYSTFCANTHS